MTPVAASFRVRPTDGSPPVVAPRGVMRHTNDLPVVVAAVVFSANAGDLSGGKSPPWRDFGNLELTTRSCSGELGVGLETKDQLPVPRDYVFALQTMFHAMVPKSLVDISVFPLTIDCLF